MAKSKQITTLLLGKRPSAQMRAPLVFGAFLLASSPACAQGLWGQFIRNHGQWPGEVEGVARVSGTYVQVRRDSMWFVAEDEAMGKGLAVALEFEGGEAASVHFEGPSSGTYYDYTIEDNGLARPFTRYGSVRLEDVWPGIDIIVRANTSAPRFDLEVDPGADHSTIGFRVRGLEAVEREPSGCLVADSSLGLLRWTSPIAWQEDCSSCPDSSQEGQKACDAAWMAMKDNVWGFAIEGRDPKKRLIVDPSLIWSTFVGATGADSIGSVSAFPNGDALIGGRVSAPSFPSSPGTFETGIASANQDLILGRFGDNGASVVWLAKLAAGTDANPGSLPIMFSVLAGDSDSAICSFQAPGLSPGFDSAAYYGLQPKPSWGTVVAKFSSDGSTLEGATQFSAAGFFIAELQGQFSDGGVLITAVTNASSPAFEIGSGLQFGVHGGVDDRYLMRLNADLDAVEYSLIYGSSIGVPGLAGCVVLEDDSVFCNGSMPPSSLPTTSTAWQPIHSQAGSTADQTEDNYFFHFSGTGDELLFASYYGLPDPPGSDPDTDRPFSIAVAGDVVWLVNEVEAGLPPLPSEVPEFELSYDFPSNPKTTLIRFDWRRGVVLSRLLGQFETTLATAGLVDGSLLLSYDADFGVFDPTPGGTPFGFEGAQGLLRVNPLGEEKIFDHGLGGSPSSPLGTSVPLSLAPIGPEHVYLGGTTFVPDLPTTPGVPDSFMAPNDPSEGYLQLLDVTPAGVRRVGVPSGGCERQPIAGVLKRPVAGEAGFGLTCAGAPPGGIGVLALSAGSAVEPSIPFENLSLYVDPGTFDLLPVVVDDSGFGRVALPIPVEALGAIVTAQFGFVEDPVECLELLASDALEITVFSEPAK